VNEYVISFINTEGVYQQLTFRGVTQQVAYALAKGLLDASFEQVSLAAKEFVDRDINLLTGEGSAVPDDAGQSQPD
jgi:hypothetical protein